MSRGWRRMPGAVVGTIVTASLLVIPDVGTDEGLATVLERVEVADLTTPTRRVFAEPDGSYTAELSVEPVRVRRGGSWVQVDTRLAVQPDGGIMPEAVPVSLRISGGGTAPLVELGAEGATIALSWLDRLPEPVLMGETVAYREVLPGVDLVVRARPQGFAQYLVVKNRDAARQVGRIRFGLVTDGVTMEVDERSNTSAVDQDGRVVFHSGPPLMWDSSGGGAATTAGPTERARRAVGGIELTDGVLTVLPDAEFLTDPDTTYPVVIDPDYDHVPPHIGWAKVFSGPEVRDDSYWYGGIDGPEAKVGYCGWAGCNGIGTARSFYQYDTGFLAGKYLKRAVLNTVATYSPNCRDAREIRLYRTGQINPGTVWPGPGWGTDADGWHLDSRTFVAGNEGYGCVDATIGFGVPLNAITAGGVSTFKLQAANEGDAYAWRKFTWNPQLVVTYNTPPRVPTNLTSPEASAPGCAVEPNEPVVPNPQPWLQARASDPDGGLVYAHFEWYIRFQASAPVGSAIVGPQGNDTVFAVRIPANHFNGTSRSKIAWRVRGFDGELYGPWSQWCDLTVDDDRPGVPVVASDTYVRVPTDGSPAGSSGAPGQSGAFTFNADAANRPENADVVGFWYGLGSGPSAATRYVAADRLGGQATVLVTPDTPLDKFLWVAAVDRAGNRTLLDANQPEHSYHFAVGCPTRNDGHWRLDGANLATAADDSSLADVSPRELEPPGTCHADPAGDDNHGTVTGIHPAPGAWWTTGRVGDALRLDGTGRGYAGVPQSPIRTDWAFTVSAWVLPDEAASGGWHAAVSQVGSFNSGFYLEYQGGSPGQFAFGMHSTHDGQGAVYVTAPRRTGGWTHLAGTYDPYRQRIQLFVNGVLVGEAAKPIRWHAAGGLQIGRAKLAGGFVDPWHGAVDEVRVYQRMLMPEEIHQLAGGPATEEVYYPFEGTGADLSGNYHNATVGAGAGWEDGPFGGRVLVLDGSDQGYAAAAGPVVHTDNSFSVSAWVRLDEPGNTSRTVVSQDGRTASGFYLQFRADTGKWTFMYPRNDQSNFIPIQASSGVPAVPGEWTHLVGVFDLGRRSLVLYVNGEEQGTADLDASGPLTPWNATGPLQVGRALWNGQRVDQLDGAVDNVQVWTGALGLTEVQRLYDDYFQDPAAPRTTAYTGQLSRYVNHGGDHFTTGAGLVPAGYRFEGPLGLPVPEGTPGARQLYACLDGADEFTSPDAGCEGKRVLGEAGLVYATQMTGIPTVPVYRCRVTAGGERFDSGDPACEGQTFDRLLGYALAYRYLVRYVRPYPPNDHRTDVVGAPAGYRAESRLGIVGLFHQPTVRGLTACFDGADEFTSDQSGCEGKQTRYWLGNAWTAPPQQAESSRMLYRCRTSATGEFFDSLDPACEGRVVDRALGYLITALDSYPAVPAVQVAHGSADVNGDGRDDIVAFTQGVLADVYVATSTGSGFAARQRWHTDYAQAGETPLTGDFNGDGRDDIVTFTHGSGSATVDVALSTGSSFGSRTRWHDDFAPVGQIPAVGDVNGDGRDDIVAFTHGSGSAAVEVALSTGSSFGPRTRWHAYFSPEGETPAVGDVNGDGRADLITFTHGSPWATVYVALSTGSSFGDSAVWHGHFAVTGETPAVADVDGDGRDDIITFSDAPWADAWVALSTGSSFGPSAVWHDTFTTDPADVPYVGDFTGEGKADAGVFRGTGGLVDVEVAPSTGSAFVGLGRWYDDFRPPGETFR